MQLRLAANLREQAPPTPDSNSNPNPKPRKAHLLGSYLLQQSPSNIDQTRHTRDSVTITITKHDTATTPSQLGTTS